MTIDVRSSCQVGHAKAAQFQQHLTEETSEILENRAGRLLAFLSAMNPKAEELKKRTHDFFMRVINLTRGIPRTPEAATICDQLLDSSGSTDSNYGAACKARTRKQFIDKVGIAAEEADESMRWLQALHDAHMGERQEVVSLVREANELASIFVASHKTAKRRLEEEERRRAEERPRRRRR